MRARCTLPRHGMLRENGARGDREDAALDGDETQPRLRRRLLVLKATVIGAAAPALAGCVVAPPGYAPQPYQTGLTDADPNDGPGQGRGGYRARTGYTDSDPGDGAGQGRGGYSPARRRTGFTDADPSDGPGYGRGGGRRGTGYTDADPVDGPGQGRGGMRRQVSDSDPRDAPGRGRGW